MRTVHSLQRNCEDVVINVTSCCSMLRDPACYAACVGRAFAELVTATS